MVAAEQEFKDGVRTVNNYIKQVESLIENENYDYRSYSDAARVERFNRIKNHLLNLLCVGDKVKTDKLLHEIEKLID